VGEEDSSSVRKCACKPRNLIHHPDEPDGVTRVSVKSGLAGNLEFHPGKPHGDNPFPLKGTEFVRRWTMHILPKGYTRSRAYGGYHGTKRGVYLARCRQLLGIATDDAASTNDCLDDAEASEPKCPHCDSPMQCILRQSRPSWKAIFERAIYADPAIYSPMLHFWQQPTPYAYPIDEYG